MWRPLLNVSLTKRSFSCRLDIFITVSLAGGLDEALYNVIAMAREQELPFVFALGRKALGRCVNKLVPVSVVGIFNYSGAEVGTPLD